MSLRRKTIGAKSRRPAKYFVEELEEARVGLFATTTLLNQVENRCETVNGSERSEGEQWEHPKTYKGGQQNVHGVPAEVLSILEGWIEERRDQLSDQVGAVQQARQVDEDAIVIPHRNPRRSGSW